jgi:hypothetical protein
MNHFAIHQLLGQTFGPMNPVTQEIKEAMKLPEEIQVLLEAIWEGNVSPWYFVPIEILIKILHKEPGLRKRDLQIKFHGISYLTIASLTKENPEGDFDIIFEASAYTPLLVSPLTESPIFWDPAGWND